MYQWLIVLLDLPEDQSLFPSTHVRRLQLPGLTCIHMHIPTCRHTHNNKKIIMKKNLGLERQLRG